jgi:hypothetical protein
MSTEKFHTLIDRKAIAERVRELGAEITGADPKLKFFFNNKIHNWEKLHNYFIYKYEIIYESYIHYFYNAYI